MWMVVFLVELYDVYWSIKLQDWLYQNEINPVGRYLIGIDEQSVALFMVIKIATIILTLTCLPLIFQKRPKLAFWLLMPLFVSRVILLYFLEMGSYVP